MKKIIIVIAVFAGVAMALSTRVGNLKPTCTDLKITFYDHHKELSSVD